MTNTVTRNLSTLGTIPQTIPSSWPYTIASTDVGSHIYHTDSTARTVIIPDNSVMPFPIGTAINFVNDYNAGTLTIQTNNDILVISGSGSQANTKNLSPTGYASAVKIANTRWILSGAGLAQ